MSGTPWRLRRTRPWPRSAVMPMSGAWWPMPAIRASLAVAALPGEGEGDEARMGRRRFDEEAAVRRADASAEAGPGSANSIERAACRTPRHIRTGSRHAGAEDGHGVQAQVVADRRMGQAAAREDGRRAQGPRGDHDLAGARGEGAPRCRPAASRGR